MKLKKQYKMLALYLVVFYAAAAVGAITLVVYKNKRFDSQKLETLLTAKAAWSDKTDDWCKYAIYGDPADVGEDYVRLNFYCKDGRKSLNALDLRTIKGKRLTGVLKEYGRINGVSYDEEIFGRSFKCVADYLEINDYQMIVKGLMKFDCQQL